MDVPAADGDADTATTSPDVALGGTVRYPLEGGPPQVTGRPQVDVGPGVSKQVLAAGSTDPPPSRQCKCFVHYQAWTAHGHEEVENTREERDPVQIIVAQDKRERAGLGVALLSMRPGERALVTVDASGAYGDVGSFSFPAVAPHAALLYDVHLLAVQRAEQEPVKARGDMLWEERMEEAARCRDRGNAAFKASHSADAMTHYLMGLSYIDDSMMAQLFGRYLDESSRLRCALHLNVAAAALALRQHDDALSHCAAALALEPANAKALYRKGRAHAALGQDDAARDALTRAAKLDPGDGAVRAALRELDAEERAKQEARRHAFGGLFGSTPPPPPPPPPLQVTQPQGEAARADAQPVSAVGETKQTQTRVMSRLLGSWWRGG